MKSEITAVINRFMVRQKLSLENYAAIYHPDYIAGFNYLFEKGFSSEKLSQKLAGIGWKLVGVEGYLSGYHYFQYLRRREIPINMSIRPGRQIDFAYFPDMIHDIMGHCPMLVSKIYTDFLDDISCFMCSIELEERDRQYLELHRSGEEKRQEIQLLIEEAEARLKEEPTPYYQCNSIALWTVEFGLIQNQQSIHAYGAALVASPREMKALYQGNTPIQELSEASAKNQFNFSNLQDSLYATQSFNEIKAIILAGLKTKASC